MIRKEKRGKSKGREIGIMDNNAEKDLDSKFK